MSGAGLQRESTLLLAPVARLPGALLELHLHGTTQVDVDLAAARAQFTMAGSIRYRRRRTRNGDGVRGAGQRRVSRRYARTPRQFSARGARATGLAARTRSGICGRDGRLRDEGAASLRRRAAPGSAAPVRFLECHRRPAGEATRMDARGFSWYSGPEADNAKKSPVANAGRGAGVVRRRGRICTPS
jgi:hypothetical protein